MPFADWFNAGSRYYWRVKAQDSDVRWSDYSPVWTFLAAGNPGVSLHLAVAPPR